MMTAFADDGFDLTVIIPTAGHASRSDSVFRAIDSVLALKGLRARPCVVLNGIEYCNDLRLKLEAHEKVDFHYLEEGGLTNAIHFGRLCVKTPYFSYLDDDDEYIASGFEKRFKIMESDSAIDVAVANGYRQSESGKRTQIFNDFARNAENPLSGLKRGNWMASCGGIFRERSVTEEYFLDVSKYFEWTWIAIRISLDFSIYFSDEHSFFVNDTKESLSKSVSYESAEVDFLLRVMRELSVPDYYRLYIRRKLAAKHITFANRALAEGRRKDAFHHYLDCLRVGRGGLPYLPWSRKLLMSRRR